MKNRNWHRLSRCALIFFSLIGTATAAQIEIVGTLRNSDGIPLSGQISIFQEVPSLVANYYQVDKTGNFRVTGNFQGEFVIHAAARHHASAEQVVPSGTAGVFAVNFVLAPGQDIEGRVVDAAGNGVPDAVVQARYHEPEKPVRRLLFGTDERTDGDGRFLIRNVGIQVPFVVDVLASNYPPASSKRLKLAAGTTKLDDIVLGAQGASVVVQVLDKADVAVSGVTVMLLADPAGLGSDTRGSWLHHRAFRRRELTSSLGNVRFTGVPPGRIITRIKTADGLLISGRSLARVRKCG